MAAGAITDAGNLTITGTTTLTAGAANDITLDNANNFGGQVRIVSGRDVTLNDVNALAFGAGGNSTVSGNLSVTAGGAVTQANGLLVTGTSAISAGAANVTLANPANNFGGAVSVTGNNVSLVDTNALVLGTVNAAGTLAVTTNGAITDTGNVTVARHDDPHRRRDERHHAEQRQRLRRPGADRQRTRRDAQRRERACIRRRRHLGRLEEPLGHDRGRGDAGGDRSDRDRDDGDQRRRLQTSR